MMDIITIIMKLSLLFSGATYFTTTCLTSLHDGLKCQYSLCSCSLLHSSVYTCIFCFSFHIKSFSMNCNHRMQKGNARDKYRVILIVHGVHTSL
ncbi:hypothetical protein C8Q75DRAFT_360220 [Abortiporus biennis]|nr:hypothetical protein C8Q75DRAFT_360220 [Abortiporus biennis]